VPPGAKPKDSIDDLIAAVEAVEILQEAITKLNRAISDITDRLERLEDRLTTLETPARPRRR